MTAQPETTHKAELELGPGVINNQLIWTSASGLTKIDENSVGGCALKWWYEQVDGKRQPSTAAQKRGTKLHADVENHITLGAPLVNPLAVPGRHFIDDGGPGIMVEAAIAKRETPESPITAWLTVGNVAIAGHVDLWNHRGMYIDREGELRRDPPNTLETKDWKTTSDFSYAKSPAELAVNVQLVTYAEVGFRAWPHLEHGRMTHVYFRTRGTPEAKLSTILCDREQIGRRWEYAEGLVRLAADVAKEKTALKTLGNRKACNAYGGCPHAKYCPVGSHDSLSDVFGERNAERIAARMRGETPQEFNVSLIDKLDPSVIAAAAQAAPQQQTMPAGVSMLAPPAVGVAVSVAPAIDAEVARLQAEENARRAAAAAGIPNGFAQALQALDASGYGAPTFVGRAAAAVAQHRGMVLPAGHGIQGVGWLAERVANPVEDPALVLQLVSEISSLPPLAQPTTAIAPPPPPMVAPPAPVVQAAAQPSVPAPVTQQAAISVLPTDAPVSNPALAAQPVEGFTNAKTEQLAALTAPPPIPGLAVTAAHVAATGQLPAAQVPSMLAPSMMAAPPAAVATPSNLTATSIAAPPSNNPAIATGTTVSISGTGGAAVGGTTTAVAENTPAAAPRKAGPGRPKGSRKAKTTDGTTTANETTAEDTTINLYVNCIPSHDFERLEPYIELAYQTLCKEYGAADIRCAPRDSPLGYDKAPGAVAALIRKNPPAPGNYVFRASPGDKFAPVIVETLRSFIEASGGELVEGWTS